MNLILNRLSAEPPASTAADQSSTAKAAVLPRARLKRIAGKAAVTVISTAVTVSILLGADLYLHHKHGINLWGYRGPAVGQKQPGEKRVVVLGGSTAWGYGLTAGQDFPGQLQQRFAERARTQGGAPIHVLNLGFNREGAYAFKYNLKDYDYLDYDAVVIYSGYNDLQGENKTVFRHRSPIFVWTGYLPLLPGFTAIKIETWMARGDRADEPVVFHLPSANESDQTAKALQRRLGQLNSSRKSEARASQGTCPVEWQFYCREIYEAADLELKRGKRVLVVTEPYISDEHVDQQLALETMVNQRFAGQANLRYLNLGRLIDLRDRSLCWDGMHLTEEGNRRIAEALTQPVLEMLGRWP